MTLRINFFGACGFILTSKKINLVSHCHVKVAIQLGIFFGSKKKKKIVLNTNKIEIRPIYALFEVLGFTIFSIY